MMRSVVFTDHKINPIQKKITVQNLELNIVYHENRWLIARRHHAIFCLLFRK